MNEETPETPLPPVAAKRSASDWMRHPATIGGVVVLVLFGWQWWDTRSRLLDTQQELAKRLADIDAVARESRTIARQGQEAAQAASARIGAVDARVQDAQTQQLALEALYQELARGRDEWAAAEIEQIVAIAAQQLQLAGNVQAALAALQTADSRLSRSDRPQFVAVRKALARDIERLKSLPHLDVTGMSGRLENVIASIDALPLAFEERPPAPVRRAARKETPPADGMALLEWRARQMASDLWAEVRSLVRVQRLDRQDVVLLSPEQTFFLRENLKLRLLNARLALLARDAVTYRNELKQANTWLTRYFDGSKKPVESAAAAIQQLQLADLSGDLPSLEESLKALRNFKAVREAKTNK